LFNRQLVFSFGIWIYVFGKKKKGVSLSPGFLTCIASSIKKTASSKKKTASSSSKKHKFSHRFLHSWSFV
jgi:hypothetical protein